MRVKSGRPPKFLGPRRPVTVTLPESTLATLAAIDPDRGRAIVKLTEAAARDGEGYKRVEVVEMTPGLGVIMITSCPILRRINGLRLVEVAPMRYLLAIPLGTSIDFLELALTDLIEEDWSDAAEHSTLIELKDLIRSLRRQGVFSKAEMLFVDTRSMGQASAPDPGAATSEAPPPGTA